LLIDQKVKEGFERISAQLQDPQFAKGVVRVESKVLHNYTCEAKAGEFRFIADEHPNSGGNGEGPTPLQYFLAGLVFCEQVIFIRHCAAHNVQVDSLETSVRGYLDRRGNYGVAEVDPAFNQIVVTMRIESTESSDKIREAITRLEKHCPAYNTLKKSVQVIHEVTLNGQELKLEESQVPVRGA